jgi:hypothetical protein
MFIFGLIGVAATLGVLRFGLSPSLFTTLHVTASTAAKFISVPLVGVALAAHFAPADIRTRMCESARARESIPSLDTCVDDAWVGVCINRPGSS